jgi:chromosome segregation ATPase
MNSPDSLGSAVGGANISPARRTDPHLSAKLQAEYEAVRNDLEQAQQLAADFQRQVADKSNEVAHIKLMLEKTTGDLSRLEQHVVELRQERHRLANELMVAGSLELELDKVRRERDRFRTELESFRDVHTARTAELQAELIQQRTEITELEEIAKLVASAAPLLADAEMNESAIRKANEFGSAAMRLVSKFERRRKEHESANLGEIDPEEISDGVIIDVEFDR